MKWTTLTQMVKPPKYPEVGLIHAFKFYPDGSYDETVRPIMPHDASAHVFSED